MENVVKVKNEKLNKKKVRFGYIL